MNSPPEVSDWFWSVVASAKKDGGRLKDLLWKMTADQIVSFAEQFNTAASELTTDEFVDHLRGQPSEDGAMDIAEWVVSQGREYYLDVLNHPEKINIEVDPKSPTIFSGVANQVFIDRFGQTINRWVMKRERGQN